MMIVFWLALAPAQLGGMASYIVVIGKSMEPKFHRGDLVIVHKEPRYQIGDVIVYRNSQLKSFVFHRIISQQMGRYTLRGDNNSWVDTYEPSVKEVIGKLWLHIPGGGTVIQAIRTPFTMALIAGALGAFLAANLFMKTAKDKKPMNDKTIPDWFTSIGQKTRYWFTETRGLTASEPVTFSPGEVFEALFFVLGLIGLSSLILGLIAFSRPASRTAQTEISYQHLGVFSYSASTSQGVYDADAITSGDPIFTKLACAVNINFQYTLVAAQTEDIAGTYQLTAMIMEESSGWQRILPLQEKTSFTGDAFGTNARLDLCKIQSLAQSMEQETDFHPGVYTLVITPHIQLDGNLSGQTLQSAFNPMLKFRYDRRQFFLIRNDAEGNPLAFTETGVLHEEYKEANTLLLLGREISIRALRWMVVYGLIISVGGLAFLGLRVRNLARIDPQKFFRIKYASTMINVQDLDPLTTSRIIDVDSMDALAKLAERFNGVILHQEQGDLHTYCVHVGNTSYCFMIMTPQGNQQPGRLKNDL